MKNINVFILTVLFFNILSCQKKTEPNLYIIDSLQLGSTKKVFKFRLGRNSISDLGEKLFYKRMIFEDINDLEKETYNSYYSKIFDFEPNELVNHYSLILPSFTLDEKLNRVDVILGHTDPTYLLDNLQNISERTKIMYYNQSMRYDYVDRIENQLIKKYGQPTKRGTEIGIPFYSIEKDKMFKTDSKNNGELLVWETDNYTVTFFKGLENYNSLYNIDKDSYFEYLEDNSEKKEIKSNQIITKSFPYIKYELTEIYLSKNKFDQPNL